MAGPQDQNILDFSDFSTTSASTSMPVNQPVRTIPNQTQTSPNASGNAYTGIEIPNDSDSKQTKTNNASSSIGSSLMNMIGLSGSSDINQSDLSEQTIQQLNWLQEKQKAIKQRNQASSNSSNTGNNWGLGYLAQYFDVTTHEVVQRIIWSAVPFRKPAPDLDDMDAPLTSNMVSQADDPGMIGVSNGNTSNVRTKYYSFIERFIQSRPDLYGPLWISITLVFSVAIFSNLVSFMDYRSKLTHDESISTSNITTPQTANPIPEWHYSMDELNMAASVITFYSTLMPILIWSLFWCQGYSSTYSLIETVCAFGYSLSIFVPLTVLFTVQSIMFRFSMLALTSIMSGIALMLSFLPVLSEGAVGSKTNGGSQLQLLIIPVCHFCLGYILHRIMLISN